MIRTLGIKQNKNLVGELGDLGTLANHAASASVFQDYRDRKAKNTVRRQDADLALFSEFLRSSGVDITGERLTTDPEAWTGVTWGLAASFMSWQLARGFAVGSINVRLSTVKTYAKLALKAGAIDPAAYALIQAVEGFSHREVKHIDAERKAVALPTRVGPKKAAPVGLKRSDADRLKDQPDTPQGRRDRLLMCLLLDHGLRVGEAAALEVEGFDLEDGLVRFYRSKVDRVQVHRLTPETLEAARAYFMDAPKSGSIWRSSASKQDGTAKFRAGALTGRGMSARALTRRVKALGAAIGLPGLSPHDCRHYWATLAAMNKTPIDRLKDAGGWSSPAMPLRYVQAAEIANEGVRL